MKNYKRILFPLLFIILLPYMGFAEERAPVLRILKNELDYNFKLLQKEEIKPYYIVYRTEDNITSFYMFSDGNITYKMDNRQRLYDVDVRVGSPDIDNTHYIRDDRNTARRLGRLSGVIPMAENDKGIRQSLWISTHEAYKNAVETYKSVIENLKTKSEEEDKSPDFLLQKPVSLYLPKKQLTINIDSICSIMQECSALFNTNPHILNNSISLQYTLRTKYFADSEGTEFSLPIPFLNIAIQIQGRAKNGMIVFRNRTFYFQSSDSILRREEFISICEQLNRELNELINAEAGDPYSGPAIFSGEAAAVFFHEIFGHRMEGHRQRDETFGQTFTKKIGQKIFPDFISIIDDPAKKTFNSTLLNGYYPIDDEGVPGQKAVLVDKGELKTFLMSRKGVQDFRLSNGHGRSVLGRQPVSRMGNLIIESGKKESLQQLRENLIRTCKEKKLLFGYYFKEVQGGWTTTYRNGPQTFKVIPILVYKIYADGRTDTLVNGIDIVGTPMASLSKIITTSSNYSIFNGHCGAESGMVPVSAISPDILFGEIEIEKKSKSFEIDPILPAINDIEVKTQGIESAMQDEMKRSLDSLKLDNNRPPFFIGYRKIVSHSFTLQSEYGDITSLYNNDNASFFADVKLGDYDTTSDYFSSDDIDRRMGRPGLIPYKANAPTIIYDDYFSARKHLWRITDNLYKDSVEKFTKKKNYLENHPDTKNQPDFSKEERTVFTEKEPGPRLGNTKEWETAMAEISAISLNYKDIDNVSFQLTSQNDKSIYINSEGSKTMTFPQVMYFSINFDGQRDDLTKIKMSDQTRIPYEADASFLRKKIPEIKEKHELFQNLLHCKAMSDYSGPVIVEGKAAADFLIRYYLMGLFSGGEPLLTMDETKKRSNYIKYRNRAILPPFISVTDDPLRREFMGQALAGFYEVDQQGVRAQRVELIKNGKLVNALYSRRPDKYNKTSTGHGRQNKGVGDLFPDISNLFIEAQEFMPAKELKKMLIEKCKEIELDSGLIIRQISEQGKIFEAYSVDITGNERLVFGGQIENFNIKSLRDIIAVSSERTVREYLNSRDPELSQVIITPDFLIEDVDIRFTPDKNPKKPPGLAPLKR